MTIPPNRLFSAAPLDSLLVAIEQQIAKTVEGTDGSLIMNGELKEMAASIESQYKLKLPRLDHTARYVSGNEDCKIDVRHDSSRNVSDRSKPCLMAGKRITVTVPFDGDAKLLMQNPKAPNAISTGATVDAGEINLVYSRPLPIDTALLERDIENDINAIDANLTFVRGQVDAFNQNLNAYITDKLSGRKSAIEAGKNALDKLSLPVRLKEKTLESERFTMPDIKSTIFKNMQKNNTRHQYDVFICHASEDKDTVATPLANGLAERGINVWYDQFTLKIGDSLMQKIDEGLRQSKYGIVILSKHFFDKHWPKRELAGLTQKEMKDGIKVILPIWHEVTRDDVFEFSPPLADKMAGSTSNMDVLLNELLDVVTDSPNEARSKSNNQHLIKKDPIAVELKIVLDPIKSQLISPQWLFQVEIWIENQLGNKISDYRLNVTFPAQLPLENNTLQELRDKRTEKYRYYVYPQDNVQPKGLYPGEKTKIGGITCIIGNHNLPLENEVMALSAAVDFVAANINKLHFDFPMSELRPYAVTKADLNSLKAAIGIISD